MPKPSTWVLDCALHMTSANIGVSAWARANAAAASGIAPEWTLAKAASALAAVGLATQHTNQVILVEGPEIRGHRVGTRRLSAGASR